jgi:radical SAM protein with 4Fe4S-binding SPASM domain
MRNLESIHRLDFPDLDITLRINYNDAVFADIKAFIDFIKTKFDNAFTIHTHPISDLGGSAKGFECSESTLSVSEEQIAVHMLTQDVNSDYSLRHITRFGAVCYASMPNSFVIDPKGTIRKCTVNIQDEKNVVGRIIDSEYFEINYYALSAWTEATVETEECKSCCYQPVCMRRNCTSAMVAGKNECTLNKSAVSRYIDALAEKLFNERIV